MHLSSAISKENLEGNQVFSEAVESELLLLPLLQVVKPVRCVPNARELAMLSACEVLVFIRTLPPTLMSVLFRWTMGSSPLVRNLPI